MNKFLDLVRSVLEGKLYKNLSIAIIASDSDKKTATGLIKLLESVGVVCWSSEDLLPGQDWAIETRKACKNAKFVLILVSKSSVVEESEYQQFVKWALEIQDQMPSGRVKTIPVAIDKVIIPDHLANYSPAKPSMEDWEKLIRWWEPYRV